MRESRNCLSSYSLEENDGKCRQMTGLSWTMFLSLFTFLNQFVKRQGYISLPPRDQLFITLIKLRQNPSFFFLSHVLKMPQTTVRQFFIRWLDLMYGKISFLVHWPDRECFSMIPPEMKAQFPRLTAIIDCFEIRTEYPSNLKARWVSQEMSTHSHIPYWNKRLDVIAIMYPFLEQNHTLTTRNGQQWNI